MAPYMRHIAVRRNIAKRCVEGSNSGTVIVFESALVFRCEFDPRAGLAIRFDFRVRSARFLTFFTGANSSSPVKTMKSQFKTPKLC